jgi:hypothetical protein
MQQLTLEDAIAAGEQGMQQAAKGAERRDPGFAPRAEALFRAHLVACPDLADWNENMVDAARAGGVAPEDDRAFGIVFKSMAARGVIECIEYGPRRKGRGTAGARKWRLCQ